MIDIIYNKWFLLGTFALLSLILYKIFFLKSKAEVVLEREILDILNSEEYKVKGQYD